MLLNVAHFILYTCSITCHRTLDKPYFLWVCTACIEMGLINTLNTPLYVTIQNLVSECNNNEVWINFIYILPYHTHNNINILSLIEADRQTSQSQCVQCACSPHHITSTIHRTPITINKLHHYRRFLAKYTFHALKQKITNYYHNWFLHNCTDWYQL